LPLEVETVLIETDSATEPEESENDKGANLNCSLKKMKMMMKMNLLVWELAWEVDLIILLNYMQ